MSTIAFVMVKCAIGIHWHNRQRLLGGPNLINLKFSPKFKIVKFRPRNPVNNNNTKNKTQLTSSATKSGEHGAKLASIEATTTEQKMGK